MKSLAELQAIREKARAQISVREGQEDGIRILVGMATCGIAAGARPVLTWNYQRTSDTNRLYRNLPV